MIGHHQISSNSNVLSENFTFSFTSLCRLKKFIPNTFALLKSRLYFESSIPGLDGWIYIKESPIK